jgi:hypothetical protein
MIAIQKDRSKGLQIIVINSNDEKVTSHDLRNALDDMLSGKPVRDSGYETPGCTIKWIELSS